MEEKKQQIVLYEDVIRDGRLSMRQMDMLSKFSSELAREAKELKDRLRSQPDDEEVKHRLSSLAAVANFAPVYFDIATFCADNGFEEVICLSPHFMYAAPFFIGKVRHFTEIYPARFKDDPESRKRMGYMWEDNRGFLPRIYREFIFCGDDFGYVPISEGRKYLIISVDTFGWPGVAESAGFRNWDNAYRHLSEHKEAVIYMPKASKPSHQQYPGQVLTMCESFHPSLQTECGIYLLSKAKAVYRAYAEDIQPYIKGFGKGR